MLLITAPPDMPFRCGNITTFGELAQARVEGGRHGKYYLLYKHWVQIEPEIAVDENHPVVQKKESVRKAKVRAGPLARAPSSPLLLRRRCVVVAAATSSLLLLRRRCCYCRSRRALSLTLARPPCIAGAGSEGVAAEGGAPQRHA